MKKFAIGFMFTLWACTPQITHIPKETFYFGIDFTKYTERGFLITPESFTGEYHSIGMVNYVIVPSANYVPVKSYVNVQQMSETVREWKVDKVDIREGLDSLYTTARRMGANAIINFKVDPAVREYNFLTNPVKLTGYELSGFAIRRKE